MTPEQIERSKRQVAVDAERHWWVTHLNAALQNWALNEDEHAPILCAYLNSVIADRTKWDR